MAMIQGIDGMALLKMFRAGREDRQADDDAAAKARESEEWGGLVRQMYSPGQKPQGVAAQFAPNKPTTTPGYGDGAFDQAFGADTQEALTNGAELPALPKPVAPPAPQQPGRMELNPEIFARMANLRPQQAAQIVSAIKTADEIGLKRMEAKNTAMGAAALSMSKIPLAQRPQYLREVLMPYLAQAGWTEQEIAGRSLTDQALTGYQHQAMTMDQAIDAEQKNREFMAGKTVAVPEGGSVATVRPVVGPNGEVQGNRAEYIIGGDGAAAPPASATPAIPKEAIDALKSGEGSAEQFDAIFGSGSAARVMGGGSGNAAGGFP